MVKRWFVTAWCDGNPMLWQEAEVARQGSRLAYIPLDNPAETKTRTNEIIPKATTKINDVLLDEVRTTTNDVLSNPILSTPIQSVLFLL